MRYNNDTCVVELSVRELCGLAHRSGNLDAAHPQRRFDAMRRGSELHRDLQKGQENYTAEVSLCNTLTHHGIT